MLLRLLGSEGGQLSNVLSEDYVNTVISKAKEKTVYRVLTLAIRWARHFGR